MRAKIPFTAVLLAALLTLPVATACGGRDIVLHDNPAALGERSSYSDTHDTTFWYDNKDNLILSKDDVRVTIGMADAIVESYLNENHPDWEEYEFESFDLEHGRPVYMYEAKAPGVALTYHVGGGVSFATDHLHYHVDAITGELLDIGCGGGPSEVLTRTTPAVSTSQPWDDVAPNGKTYFYTHNVITEGHKPIIDGKDSRNEWADATSMDGHLGVSDDDLTAYGCGGPGRTVSWSGTEEHISVRYKTVEDVLYVQVKADEPNWLGIMFKDFAHHGMIGDFGDVKILSTNGVSDYYLASDKNSDAPVKKTGLHGCYGYGKLVPDASSNIIEQAYSGGDEHVWEFSMPLNNQDPADTHWSSGQAYQVAYLRGGSEYYNGLEQSVSMSGQEVVRVGEQRDFAFSHENPAHEHTNDDHHDEEEQGGFIAWLISIFE